MESTNLDLVRSAFADWERGDFRSAEWADPLIEFTVVGGPTAGTWRGHAGIAEGWRDFLGPCDEFRVAADEYRELDGERILVLTRWRGRGRSSRLDLDQMSTESAMSIQFRAGMVTRLVPFFDRDRALADRRPEV